MGRRAWQGLLDWWKPEQNPKAKGGECAAGMERSERRDDVRGWARMRVAMPPASPDPSAVLNSCDVADATASVSSAPGENIQPDPSAHGLPIENVSEDEELAAFLAADYAPVDADPEFKRKLRDQLWTLIQGNEMTRQ